MAQEALELAAEKLGVHIKVETHGQIGIENALSADEIANADGVIIAADGQSFRPWHDQRFCGRCRGTADARIPKAPQVSWTGSPFPTPNRRQSPTLHW
ncbi:hypothetical protein GCM10027038_12440 [Arthrobacter bambusae]|uniref:Phosphotransferase system EIIB component type 2/3 domain-containing protein n=2 Tax=Arthrobacter TaxID=1663 RepID=A0AAW8DLQ5_9MICC|nr:hypothetical protein [Arthrobacter bambusae]MDQ0131427.1 hypothetical protein [Arthrobacter bambusae]MDQ0182761.1 hypothetical protein [Arthrobacter bambusae]